MFVLNLILLLKKQIIECNSVKPINENSQTSQYKTCQNYFFDTMTNIKSFDPNLLSIDQISFYSTDCIINDILPILFLIT